MNKMNETRWMKHILTCSVLILQALAQIERPNLVVVYTDEHNFRTIGAYRELLGKNLSELWGDGVVVETPNLDRLAHEGCIFTSFYTVAPLCTPSRASFMTGLYPKATGAWLNNNAMFPSMITWAEILQQNGYHTGYVGKWHLNGDEKPGWNSKHSFGFTETKWQYNRGHWKFFEDDPLYGPQAYEWTTESETKFADSMEQNYATDFLMDRGIDIIENAISKDLPFAVMISIPDPHAPNVVRPPYDSMYTKFEYEVPFTGQVALTKEPALPGWTSIAVNISDAASVIQDLEADRFRHRYFSNLYGMVKLVDDNVGKLLNHLESRGIDKNTIVVFTSDHGDQMGEHAKHNKGRPYETSAGVAMLMRWPNKIPKQKVINTAYSSIDFAPTILSMMGLKWSGLSFHGIDGAEEILSRDVVSDPTYSKRQTRFMTDSAASRWAAAVRDDYKLTISKTEPWLFDLSVDPHEIYNFYNHANYTSVIAEMQEELYDTMFQHQFPLTDTSVIYWSKPACWDSKNQITTWKRRLCNELSDPRYSPGCKWRKIYEQCPVVCSRCCEDSTGPVLFRGALQTCSSLSEFCSDRRIRSFCPMTCNNCHGGTASSGDSSEGDNGTTDGNDFDQDDDAV